MLTDLVVFLRTISLICAGHHAVALENVALRQQLAVCLLKTPFLLQALMLPPTADTLLARGCRSFCRSSKLCGPGRTRVPPSSSRSWRYGTNCKCCNALDPNGSE
jgi:hypothetical protein